MILALGARGPGFKSRLSPPFNQICFSFEAALREDYSDLLDHIEELADIKDEEGERYLIIQFYILFIKKLLF